MKDTRKSIWIEHIHVGAETVNHTHNIGDLPHCHAEEGAYFKDGAEMAAFKRGETYVGTFIHNDKDFFNEA